MSNVPDTIVLERDRDLRGRRKEAWIRLVLTVVVFMVPLLALLNLFGQRPSHSHAATPAVKLSVDARYLGASK